MSKFQIKKTAHGPQTKENEMKKIFIGLLPFLLLSCSDNSIEPEQGTATYSVSLADTPVSYGCEAGSENMLALGIIVEATGSEDIVLKDILLKGIIAPPEITPSIDGSVLYFDTVSGTCGYVQSLSAVVKTPKDLITNVSFSNPISQVILGAKNVGSDQKVNFPNLNHVITAGTKALFFVKFSFSGQKIQNISGEAMKYSAGCVINTEEISVVDKNGKSIQGEKKILNANGKMMITTGN